MEHEAEMKKTIQEYIKVAEAVNQEIVQQVYKINTLKKIKK